MSSWISFVQIHLINLHKPSFDHCFILISKQEQAHQYSLTIVALEDRLLKINKSKRKSEDENIFMKQYKGKVLIFISIVPYSWLRSHESGAMANNGEKRLEFIPGVPKKGNRFDQG